jgi:uncharacterized membrane protein YdcZ (DUF606 family)
MALPDHHHRGRVAGVGTTVIDKFGLFGMETHALSVGRMVGAGLMVAGLALISYF